MYVARPPTLPPFLPPSLDDVRLTKSVFLTHLSSYCPSKDHATHSPHPSSLPPSLTHSLFQDLLLFTKVSDTHEMIQGQLQRHQERYFLEFKVRREGKEGGRE